MQYILITGGAGYIGSHTNALLNALGVRTIVLDSLIYGHKEALEISENTESRVTGHSVLSDKSLIQREGIGHYRLGNSLHPSLESNDFSSQSLECQEASQAQDSKTSSESKENLESRFKDLDSNLESKAISESTKNLESKFTHLQSSQTSLEGFLSTIGGGGES